MNNWQVGRITFGPLDRLVSKIRGHHQQGDVIIPITPPQKEFKNISVGATFRIILDQTLRNGENLDAALEKFCDLEGYYGCCEPEYMNGDVCTKPKCRMCAKSTLRSLIRSAIEKDFEAQLGKFMMNGQGEPQ